MRDLGFEVIEEGQQENLPTMQTFGAVKEEPLQCFIHDCKLEKCTSQTGWEYVKCPMYDCFIFTGLDKVNRYLKYVQDQIPVWYKWNKEKLKCFCSEPLVLCESRSEQNPGRMYFKCQKNRCKFFQWGNEMPSCKNMGWLRGSEQVGCKSPAPMYKSLYEKTLDEISESRPLLSVTGKDPLWDEVLATSIMVVDSTNEIVSPAELKGYRFTPSSREELLQYLYLTRKLNSQAQVKAVHPSKVEVHQKAAACGLSG